MRHLLIIDGAGNVMLADADGDLRIPIGAPLLPEMRSQVTTAAWSAQGQWTAWSVDSNHVDGLREVRLHDEATDQASVLVEAVSAFYMNPSPDGRWLSHLSPGPLGLELAISDIASGAIHVVERGQPMFWSWSPDSTQLAVHVENRVVVSDVAVSDVVVSDRAADSQRPLTDDAGPFVTPVWLPGGAVLYAVDDRLVVAGPDAAVTPLVSGGSAGRFSLDPESRRLAYISTEGDAGALVILDLVTLTSVEVTSAPVAAFFWSPDGSHLAALAATGNGSVQWLVLDGSTTVELAAFQPTRRWAATVLPFFEQYSQSHQVWSRDATTLVAPAVRADQSGALLQPIHSPDEARWIPDAELVWWA